MNQDSRNQFLIFAFFVAGLFALCVSSSRTWQSFDGARSGVQTAARLSVAADDRQSKGQEVQSTRIVKAVTFPGTLAFAQLEPPVADRLELIAPDSSTTHLAPSVESTKPIASPPIDVPETVLTPTLKREPTSPAIESPIEPPAPKVATGWPSPTRLVAELNELSLEDECRGWALSVLDEIERLRTLPSLKDGEAVELLKRMDSLAVEGRELASNLQPPSARTGLQRIVYSLERRLEVWQQVHETVVQSSPDDHAPDTKVINERIEDAANALRELDQYQQWFDFLFVDRAREAFRNEETSRDERRQLALKMLSRIESPELVKQHRVYFEKPVFQKLKSELRHWAAEPVDYRKLLAEVEKYEQFGSSEQARIISADCRSLMWSQDDKLQELGQRLDSHFRNGNIRIAASGRLLNRYLPSPQKTTEDVNEVIGGAEVYGQSNVSNRLFLRLLPDATRIRLGLEAYGVVESDTEAHAGPVVFWNAGNARFRARKLILLDHDGVRMKNAEAAVNSNIYVTGLESNYDGWPILGSIARSIAMREHDERAAQSKPEVDRRVENKITKRLDREFQTRLVEADQKFRKNVLQPLRKLQLNPEPVGMETTDKRATVRYRLAGFSQLAAHTPRPQAMSDSMLSVQFHQSALNNAVEHLYFDGGTFDVRDLYSQLAGLIGYSDASPPEDLPTNVTIKFADTDALRFNFLEGRVAVNVRIAKLSVGRRKHWRDFAVRVHYVTDIDALDARFIRDPDGYLELASKKHLRLGDQIALRGIFSKVFSTSRAWSVIPPTMSSDRRLQDLRISQFEVTDGWIGLALAPRRNAYYEVKNPRSLDDVTKQN